VYGGGIPTNINVIGNYFENVPGPSSTANVDINSAVSNPPPSYITFSGNTFGGTLGALYIRANNVTVSGNTFLSPGYLTVDYYSPANVPTSNVLIGVNNWLGTGTIQLGANSSLYSNVQLATQMSVGTITQLRP
jgi:hypothetical protein